MLAIFAFVFAAATAMATPGPFVGARAGGVMPGELSGAALTKAIVPYTAQIQKAGLKEKCIERFVSSLRTLEGMESILENTDLKPLQNTKAWELFPEGAGANRANDSQSAYQAAEQKLAQDKLKIKQLKAKLSVLSQMPMGSDLDYGLNDQFWAQLRLSVDFEQIIDACAVTRAMSQNTAGWYAHEMTEETRRLYSAEKDVNALYQSDGLSFPFPNLIEP